MVQLSKSIACIAGISLVSTSSVAAFSCAHHGKKTCKPPTMAVPAVVRRDNEVDTSTGDFVDTATREIRITSPLMSIFASLSSSFSLVPNAANAALSANAFDSSLQTYFPGALTNSAIALRVAASLRDRGYTRTNTLFGSSLCSDEINDTAESLVGDLQNKLGVEGVFNLGGLGGLPFVGISGMGAFTSHAPVDGKIFIVFGPHVGVSNDGVVGKIERVGKKSVSGSCGAGIGAYKAIIAMKDPMPTTIIDAFSIKDVQEEYIISQLSTRLDSIKGKEPDNDTITYVTNKMYDLVWEMLRSEVNAFTTKADFWGSVTEVTLLGGIVVNRGHGEGVPGGEDFYQPLMLKSLTKDGESDIYGEVFGDFPALARPYRTAKYV
jgi:hypothetical protein